MQADAVIVGAGIVGAACAYYLAEGGLKVYLIERGSVASGTSGSGEGNILISDKSPGPELELAKLGLKVWKELAKTLPHDFEFEEKGGIVVAEAERHLSGLQNTVVALQSEGLLAQMLTTAELREAEPFLAQDVAGAAFFPQDCQVQPMLASAALVHAATRQGAIFLDHTELLEIERDRQGAISGVQTSKGQIATPILINAAGPWSPLIAAKVNFELPVEPRKGHILVTEPLPKLVFHKVFEASYADTVNSGEADLQVASVVEGTKSGTILLGSSRQRVGFEPTVEVPVLKQIVKRAVRYFPVLNSAHALRAYVGFRAFAPDHLPVIGEVPGVPGFYVNTAHEGAGIGLGPASSLLLAQHILGQPLSLDLTPFRVSRFAENRAALIY